MIFINDMRYSFLIFFTLAGCAHKAQAVEEQSNDDILDLLSEDELEGIPESRNSNDENDPQEDKND